MANIQFIFSSLISNYIYSEHEECLRLESKTPSDKRSYNQSQLVWIKEAGLQADIQKILRQARKMPDKIQSFYKVTLIHYEILLLLIKKMF